MWIKYDGNRNGFVNLENLLDILINPRELTITFYFIINDNLTKVTYPNRKEFEEKVEKLENLLIPKNNPLEYGKD